MKIRLKKDSILSELSGVKMKRKKEPSSEKLFQKKRHVRNKLKFGHE